MDLFFVLVRERNVLRIFIFQHFKFRNKTVVMIYPFLVRNFIYSKILPEIRQSG